MPTVFSSDRTIQEQSVTFVVDANILVEFDAIHRINWRLLCPKATSVQIVVPPTVVREMDRHKRGVGRLRPHTLEFNKLLLQIEDGNGEMAELHHDHVNLSLTLMPRYARDELPDEKLSFDVTDDLIVAEAVRFTQDHPNAVFLTDDNNARRTAREMRIRVARPAEEWRRIEPRDPRDVQIENLTRQLGAMPRLSLSLLTDDETAVLFEELHEDEIPDSFSNQVANAILKRNPGYSRDELLRRHNLPRAQGRLQLSLVSPFAVSVTSIDRYCDDYKEYKGKVVAWSKRLPRTLSELCFAAPVQLVIRNEGEAFANDVEVSVKASNGYSFHTGDFFQSYLQIGGEPPEPPSERGRISSLASLFEQQRRYGRDPLRFYLTDSFDGDRTVSDISYECERFRHGTSFMLQCSLLKERNAPTGGHLLVRVSSASLADAVEQRIPIRAEPSARATDFIEHLRRRLFFFPEEVQDSILEVLECY